MRKFVLFELAGSHKFDIGDTLDTGYILGDSDYTIKETLNMAFKDYDIFFKGDYKIKYIATAIEPAMFNISIYRFFKCEENDAYFFIDNEYNLVVINDYKKMYKFPNFEELPDHNMVVMTDNDTTMFTIYTTNETLDALDNIDDWVDDLAEYVSKRYELVECCNKLQKKFPMDINNFIMEYENPDSEDELTNIQLII